MTADPLRGGDAVVDSIVGQGTRLTGQLDLTGMLRIDGHFNGVVHTAGQVLIGRTGRTECTVQAGAVIVAGAMRGDIVATELVELRSTAQVVGAIRTPRLIVEDGGRFCGRCHAGGERAETAAETAALTDGSAGHGESGEAAAAAPAAPPQPS